MKKIINQQKIILLAIIIVLFFVGFWGIKSIYADINNLQAKETGIKIEIEKEKEIQSSIKKVLEEKDGSQSEMDKIFKALPDEDELPLFISQISSLARTHSLILLSMKPSIATTKASETNILNKVKIMNVGVNLNGSYGGFKKFIKSIEDLSRYVDISSISIDASKNSNFYDFSFDLLIYYLE